MQAPVEVFKLEIETAPVEDISIVGATIKSFARFATLEMSHLKDFKVSLTTRLVVVVEDALIVVMLLVVAFKVVI